MFTTMATRNLKVLVTSVSAFLNCVARLSLILLLGISVDNLDAACERFESLNVNWKKRLTDGRMRNVAFILDPDNYWIEVIQNETLKRTSNW